MNRATIHPSGYMVATMERGDDGSRALHGYSHPTIYKTFRNAQREALLHWNHLRERPGEILLFDPDLLPVVTHDELADYQLALCHEENARLDKMVRVVAKRPGAIDHLTELEFAERQIQLWAARALKLTNQERA